ncbi:hypothetical protein BDY21DRAFT_353454 [Lineolata rhizophorae]|uniref:Uncharacterized protein n=1 Tax=Lineolata rhizophorae TaxID=578093 RepID=A0A6A6NR16_9PEZI|nr:hypothetical protein BDY21DRAFT_353454 [Lineolata rhizophorae]
MGWFWGSSTSSNPSDDPLQNLDPELRDFLRKESHLQQPSQQRPQKQKSAPPTAASPTTTSSPTSSAEATRSSTTDASQSPSHPPVPPQSLYQDGRYAHLWKTYRPLSSIESASLSEPDKLRRIMEAYNDRKSRIGEAALENCAIEQIALHDCYHNNGATIGQRLKLCTDERRKHDRCFTLQAKFLTALGYLAEGEKSEAEEERVQMHADRLYHRMLVQEGESKKALEEGRKTMGAKPILSGEQSAQSEAEAEAMLETQVARMPPNLQKAYRDGTKNAKSLAQKELELKLLQRRMNVDRSVSAEVEKVMKEEKRARDERRERGEERIGDRMRRWFGSAE